MTAATDEQLVAAIVIQDVAAFAALVDRHHAQMLGLAFRTLGERARAEDAVQEAFLKLWTQAERFDPSRGTVRGWMSRILVNLCLDQRRSLRVVTPLDEADAIADGGMTPEQAAQQADGSRRLHDALDGLPARQRAALALFHLEGYSMAETAEILETNEKAVESLLSRGRAALRQLLGAPLRTGQRV